MAVGWGVRHDAVVCFGLQPAAPIGRSPLPALPLDPFPPVVSLFHCSMSGSHGGGSALAVGPGRPSGHPNTNSGEPVPNGGFWAPGCGGDNLPEGPPRDIDGTRGSPTGRRVGFCTHTNVSLLEPWARFSGTSCQIHPPFDSLNPPAPEASQSNLMRTRLVSLQPHGYKGLLSRALRPQICSLTTVHWMQLESC